MSKTTTHIKTQKRSIEHGRSKLIPALRFKEFDGEWRETTLGNLFTFKNGLNSDKEKYGSGMKFINVLDIIGNNVITNDSIIGKVEVTEKELEKNEVIYGDVLFQRSSETREEVGQANIYVDENNSAVFGGFVIRGRKKEDYNPYYINYLLKTSPVRKEITTKSGGSTRYNVGQESLSQVFVNLTNVPEQQKIASFLSAVDEKIQQLIKKKELLEQYKKGVMQQLFSGQLRFKPDQSSVEGDQNGNPYPDWEEKRFFDLMKEVLDFRGRTPLKLGMEWGGDILSLSANNVKNGFIDLDAEGNMGSEELYEKWMGKVNLEQGDIVFTMEAPLGKALLVPDNRKYILSQRVVAFKSIEDVSNDFLIQLIWSKKFQNTIERLSTGSTAKGINQKSLKKVKSDIPCLEEQQKIATYLSSIDTKIESVASACSATEKFKKGLLQQMFV